MKRPIHIRNSQRTGLQVVLSGHRASIYRCVLIGFIMMLGAAPALAQPIVITESESRPLIDSRRDGLTFISDSTFFLWPEHAMLQALADQNGENQLWDLSAYSYGDGLPFAHFFRDFTDAVPGFDIPAYQMANCVIEFPAALNPGSPGDMWAYYFFGNGRLEFFGALAVGLFRSEHAPGELERLFPVEFGQSWSSTFTRTIIGGPGGAVTVTIDSQVDGWGMLRIPGAADVPALRILTITQFAGSTFLEPSIRFVTKGGVEATLGFDTGFLVWESISYTTETITGGGSAVCGSPGDPTDSFVLLIVDDALNLSVADQAARDLLISLDLVVVIVSDEAVTSDDASDKDLIVVSGSSDASLISADWSATAVPIVSWNGEFFDELELTGNISGTDYGLTSATNTLSIVAASHPIANGASGDFDVTTGAFPMNYGVPPGSAQVVATADGGRATIFTFETGALLADGSSAPARRVGFYMDPDGPTNANVDGMILLRNTILWSLGREAEINTAVAIETRDSAIPKAFALDQNYPNPFNPSTIIPFSVSATGPVTLKVYNALGQQIAVLVDGAMPAGNYTTEFRAGNLPSGIYLYQLRSGDTVISRQMLLVK